MTTPDNAVSDRAPETLDPDAYDNRLDELANALYEFADQNGGWTGRGRKNVTTITLARGALDVELGYHDGEHSAFLAVRDRNTGMHCMFDEGLPTKNGLLGLLRGQMAAASAPADTIPEDAEIEESR